MMICKQRQWLKCLVKPHKAKAQTPADLIGVRAKALVDTLSASKGETEAERLGDLLVWLPR